LEGIGMGARTRILIERILASVTGFLGLLTIFSHSWIEGIFGWDPDHGNGSVEWLIIVGLLAVSVAFFTVSRAEVRRLAAAGANS
jgi:hypothetical protein